VAILYVLICSLMYIFQEKLLFRPTVMAQDQAWDFQLEDGPAPESKVEEVFLDAAMGGKVNLLHFKLDNPKGAILYLHGNGGCNQNYMRRRRIFLENGWEVAYLDYRGYGKSLGELSQEGLDADVRAGWDYLAKLFPKQQLIIYGHSMGSGFATRLAAEVNPRHLILETPYTSLADVGQWQYPWLPVRWLIRYPSPSLEYAAKLSCPLDVIHGTADRTIPYEQGLAMSKAPNKGQITTIEGAGHNDCKSSPLYAATIQRILR
jgi:hypothetical protein